MSDFSKVILSGYYGYNNAGDELILDSILNGFKKYFPDTEVNVLMRGGKSRENSGNVRFLHRYDPVSILVNLINSDALILGGGGLIQDHSGILTVYYYYMLMALAKILFKKLIVFNQGIGPIKSRFNLFIARILFKKADFIAVRDEYSKEYMQWLIGDDKDIILGADPVFTDISVHKKEAGKEMRRIGVSVRKWKNYRVEDKLAVIVKKLKAKGEECFNIPFHRDYDGINIEGVEEINWEHPRQIWQIFSGLDGLIGMRLHSLIIGVLCGLPVVGISYDPKVTSFCGFMGIPCHEVDNISDTNIIVELEELFDKNVEYTEKIEDLNRRLTDSWERLKSFVINGN
ncbi:polysaccharide pyruvyl transferase CsaB [Elusimicrobiota bacterium]